MQTISTNSTTCLTGTAIADAVQRYALALARHGRVDIVDIPVILPGGEHGRSAFLVGWLMDATTTTAPADRQELLDAAGVDDLRRREEELTVPRGLPFSASDLAENWPDLDLDFPPQREHA